MSTDATDIRCAECGRDITHATSIYLVSGRYVCDICYVRLTAPRDCKHGHLARSCEIYQLEADNAALRARVAELEAALEYAIKELGFPTDTYPAPVVNAWVMLKAVFDRKALSQGVPDES